MIARLRQRLKRAIRNAKVRRWTEEVRRSAICEGMIRVNGPGTINSPRKLRIGDNTHFAGYYYIDARGGVTIGENCHISRNFICYSASHDYEGEAIPYDHHLVRREVVIEDNVWIGMNVCVVPGVKIGEGSVIAMGAVVVKEVPPLAVVGGNPAKILKYRDAQRYARLIKEGQFGGVSGKLVMKPKRDV